MSDTLFFTEDIYNGKQDRVSAFKEQGQAEKIKYIKEISLVVRAMEIENSGFMNSDRGLLWMNQLGGEQRSEGRPSED